MVGSALANIKMLESDNKKIESLAQYDVSQLKNLSVTILMIFLGIASVKCQFTFNTNRGQETRHDKQKSR